MYSEAGRCEAVFTLFGRGDRSLPEDFMREHPEKALRIPMAKIVNMSAVSMFQAAVCMIVYEALR